MADTDYFDPSPQDNGPPIDTTPPTANGAMVEDAEVTVGWAVAVALLAVLAWAFLPAVFPVLVVAAAIASLVAVAKVATAITDYVTGGLMADPKRPAPPIVTMLRRFVWLFWLLLLLGVAVWYYKRPRARAR